MSFSLTRAVYQTLAYADVFDYPLTSTEVWFYLIANQQIPLNKVYQTLVKMTVGPDPKVVCRDDFFCLTGRLDLVARRIEKAKNTRPKREVIAKTLPLIKAIPSVLFIGLTGKLVMGMADPDDDIDLLIITERGTLWTTRLLTNLILDTVGRRRRPQQRNVKDKICLNMFLDSDSLTLPKSERDVYLAHEVIQLEPLFDRDGIYPKLLRSNRWVRHYLANAYDCKLAKTNFELPDGTESPNSFIRAGTNLFFRFVEPVARLTQLRYMRPRVTNEVLTSKRVRFHPQDARGWVIPEFRKRLKLAKDLPGI